MTCTQQHDLQPTKGKAMTANDIVAELKALASAQTKKSWMTHGAREPYLGVKVADMKKIQKRIKTNYQLALDLYDTGIADAMYLAGLIADDAKMTMADLQRWVEAANSDWVVEYTVPWVSSASPHGRALALKWIESADASIAAAGWQTYSSILAIKADAELDMAEITALLQRIAKSIQQQPNRVKYVMNGFVIAVACYVKALHPLAVQIAHGLGAVAVELAGACQIPFAPDHIKKFEARSTIGKKRKSPKC